MTGLTISEVAAIIRETPAQFLATVRPVASVQKALKQDFTRIDYADIVHFKTDDGRTNGVKGSPPLPCRLNRDLKDDNFEDYDDCEVAYAVVNKTKQTNGISIRVSQPFSLSFSFLRSQ